MKIKFATTSLILSVLLAPFATYGADSDTDRSHPKAFVKDSVITTKIKAKLAAEDMATTMHISVDTDMDGVVWLSGTAKTRTDAEKAVSIARATEGVSTVKDEIKIKPDQ
jgi:hyperosmotically inducible protein